MRETDPARALNRIADIAADVLQPLPREGTLAGQEDVATRYGVHRTFVSAALRRAVRENLLSVRIQRLPIVKRDTALEEERGSWRRDRRPRPSRKRNRTSTTCTRGWVRP
jgi:hypothetical protein